MLRTVNILLAIIITAACTNQKSRNEITKDFTEEEFEKHYKLKSKGLESVLGKSDSLVGHAIIPFEVGGAVDMYYYSSGIPGTGFATMELIQPDGSGPIPNRTGTYEFVAFTRLDYVHDTTATNQFNLIERRTCSTFTAIGNYAFENKLEPLS